LDLGAHKEKGIREPQVDRKKRTSHRAGKKSGCVCLNWTGFQLPVQRQVGTPRWGEAGFHENWLWVKTKKGWGTGNNQGLQRTFYPYGDVKRKIRTSDLESPPKGLKFEVLDCVVKKEGKIGKKIPEKNWWGNRGGTGAECSYGTRKVNFGVRGYGRGEGWWGGVFQEI